MNDIERWHLIKGFNRKDLIYKYNYLKDPKDAVCTFKNLFIFWEGDKKWDLRVKQHQIGKCCKVFKMSRGCKGKS